MTIIAPTPDRRPVAADELRLDVLGSPALAGLERRRRSSIDSVQVLADIDTVLAEVTR